MAEEVDGRYQSVPQEVMDAGLSREIMFEVQMELLEIILLAQKLE